MTKKVKPVEVVVVSYEEYTDTDFVFPSKYCFKNAMGAYVFILTSKWEVATQYMKDNYNNMYSIRKV